MHLIYNFLFHFKVINNNFRLMYFFEFFFDKKLNFISINIFFELLNLSSLLN